MNSLPTLSQWPHGDALCQLVEELWFSNSRILYQSILSPHIHSFYRHIEDCILPEGHSPPASTNGQWEASGKRLLLEHLPWGRLHQQKGWLELTGGAVAWETAPEVYYNGLDVGIKPTEEFQWSLGPHKCSRWWLCWRGGDLAEKEILRGRKIVRSWSSIETAR